MTSSGMSSRRSRSGGTDTGITLKPVIQIFAKGIFGHLLVEIAVGGGDHAHVDGDFVGAADRPHTALLQHPQQLDLHGQRHFADLVKKDGSLVAPLRTSPRLFWLAPVKAPFT